MAVLLQIKVLTTWSSVADGPGRQPLLTQLPLHPHTHEIQRGEIGSSSVLQPAFCFRVVSWPLLPHFCHAHKGWWVKNGTVQVRDCISSCPVVGWLCFTGSLGQTIPTPSLPLTAPCFGHIPNICGDWQSSSRGLSSPGFSMLLLWLNRTSQRSKAPFKQKRLEVFQAVASALSAFRKTHSSQRD